MIYNNKTISRDVNIEKRDVQNDALSTLDSNKTRTFKPTTRTIATVHAKYMNFIHHPIHYQQSLLLVNSSFNPSQTLSKDTVKKLHHISVVTLFSVFHHFYPLPSSTHHLPSRAFSRKFSYLSFTSFMNTSLCNNCSRQPRSPCSFATRRNSV